MTRKTEPGHDGVTRRDFLECVGVATGCALITPLLQACEVAEIVIKEGGEFPFDIKDLAGLEKVGGMVPMKAGDHKLLLIRVDDSTVVALSQTCPHMNLSLSPDNGGKWDGKKLVCPWHKSEFGADGKYLGGVTVAPKDVPDLPSYEVVFDAKAGTGVIKVGGGPA